MSTRADMSLERLQRRWAPNWSGDVPVEYGLSALPPGVGAPYGDLMNTLLVLDDASGEELQRCSGPDPDGSCPRVTIGDLLPCAGHTLEPEGPVRRSPRSGAPVETSAEDVRQRLIMGQELHERVQAYALPNGPQSAQRMRLRQRGEIRSGADRPWMPFTAEQWVDGADLGFRWVARARMARLIPVTVTDEFADGHGLFEISFLGFPIQRLPAGRDTDAGEFLRLIAELPWCPPAYTHPDLSWDAVDCRTLRVTFAHRAVRGTVNFVVDEDGRVLEARTESRGRSVGKAIVPTPWWGRYGEYKDYGAVRLPSTAEVFWGPPEGAYPYVRIEILDAALIARTP